MDIFRRSLLLKKIHAEMVKKRLKLIKGNDRFTTCTFVYSNVVSQREIPLIQQKIGLYIVISTLCRKGMEITLIFLN